MRRVELIEIHDHPRFPAKLRDLVTDALEALWEFGNSYRPIMRRLGDKLAQNAQPMKVLDLCSGGGGPWRRFAAQLATAYNCPLQIELTDKYPNAEAGHRLDAAPTALPGSTAPSKITFARQSVDAMRVPGTMSGFRTMFSSFHHFGPAAARQVLASAVESGNGIGIFEVARRGPKTMFVLCFTPLLVLFVTPAMRPFRWSRLLWTYLIPVVPFVIGYDGWVSCLRAYSLPELHELVAGMNTYSWEIGEERTGFLPVTYLIGSPKG